MARTETKAKTIYESILSVRRKLEGVAKNGTNSYHKYNYATINDVIHEVRDAVNEEGLLFIPSKIEDIDSSKGDTVESFTITYKVMNEAGQTLDVVLRAAGEDKGDKKAYKANTGALKYLFLQLFLLPTDADPENDNKQPPAAPQAPKTLPWLKLEQLNAALDSDIKGLQATLKNEGVLYKLGKEAKKKLTDKLNELETAQN